jgi:hypothetical protein
MKTFLSKAILLAVSILAFSLGTARLPAAQPEMNAAIEALEKARHAEPIKHLEQAKHHLEEASHNKHGERVAAIRQIDAAIGDARKHEHKRMEGHISRAIEEIREGETGRAQTTAQASQGTVVQNATLSSVQTVQPAGNIGIAAAAAGSAVLDPGHPRVNEVNGRENNQQERIANGEKNGSLTSQQAGQLGKAEQWIQNREAVDMAKHDGHLTKGEQQSLNRKEDRVSHRIHQEKKTGKKKTEEKKA